MNIPQFDILPDVIGAMSRIPYDPEIAEALTFTSKYEGGHVIENFKKAGDKMWVPRECVPHNNLAGGYEDRRIIGEAKPIIPKCAPNSNEQADLILQSINLLNAGHNHVLEAPTGFGKSYIGCSVAARMGLVTYIIVSKSDLFHEWEKTLLNLIGVPASDIGYLKGPKTDYKGKRFVLCMVQSLISEGKYDQDVFDQPGMIICDEVHRLGAPQFSKAIMEFKAYYRLGLSATPDRPDNLADVFHCHLGATRVRGKAVPMSPKVLVKQTGHKLPKKMKQNEETGVWEAHPPEYNPTSGSDSTKLAKAAGRNKQIVEFLVQAHAAGRNSLVLSDLIGNHLEPLYKMLLKAGIPAIDMAYYHGQAKSGEIKRAKETAKIVLGTYGMCSEGTDVPRWDCLVMALPRANVKQPVGRVLRKMPGKRQPVVLELVDNHATLKGWFNKRLTQYYSIQSDIVKVN